MFRLSSLLFGLLLVAVLMAEDTVKLKQTNLLLIVFDDLRPELSFLGRPAMITPNFERLANRSVIFDYAYAQIAVCNPSRDSLFTGLRPDVCSSRLFRSFFVPNVSFTAPNIRSILLHSSVSPYCSILLHSAAQQLNLLLNCSTLLQ